MTDLHTHILPRMDDGAKDAEESLAMLRMERMQGVDCVVLSPHFYRNRETAVQFLSRREAAIFALEKRVDELPEEERTALPRRILGAEVAWHPALLECDELPLLCIGQTKNFLLELPFTPWSHQMFNQIYDLIGQTGLTPVIAHLERYMKIQRREHIREVFELDIPVQISAEILTHPLARGRVMKLLEKQRVHAVASDCHNCTDRPPNLGAGMQVVRRKLGDWCAQALERSANELAGLTG